MMEFRPCIDIHNGKVKQIVGGSLRDEAESALENFVSEQNADYYADFYRKKGIVGGHIILLNPATSDFYKETKAQAIKALSAYPMGLQIGGGINADNAVEFLEAGASHVIVTSYVFQNGEVNFERLNQLKDKVGQKHIVLDLSCRKKGDQYYVVTDRWQKFTEVTICEKTLDELADYCDEFLIHAVDVEGKSAGIEKDLVKLLGEWNKIPMTYAGGVHSYEDLMELRILGKNKINVTIGSALDLFGGPMEFDKILDFLKS